VAVDLWSDGTVQNRERINLALSLDYISLNLDQVTLDEGGLLAAVGTWQLPLSQGGGIATTPDGCDLPLGNTGAYLTKVVGSVVLEDSTQVFKIDVGMAFGPAPPRIGRPVEANLYAQLGINYPYFAPVIERQYHDVRDQPFGDTVIEDNHPYPTIIKTV
jgi:hypothetical protein